MEFIKKVKNWFSKKCLKFFLWMNKRRPLSVAIFFLFGLLLAFGFLWFITKPIPEEIESFYEKISYILLTTLEKDNNYLEKYPTIILALISLPVAAVLWLFRNHDIVMNLDLQMYHEAVRNIHNHDDEKASEGLRQVAFKTLVELKEKWVWGKKIRENVFPKANLRKLDLYEAKLQNVNLTKIYLTGTNLTGATLTDATLTGAILTDATLTETNLRVAILTGAYLARADLTGADLTGAYYYKDEEAEQKDERTPVTKKWLRERGAKNVDTVYGIPEE